MNTGVQCGLGGEGLALRDYTGKYWVRCNVGMAPYAAGADYVFIDPLALTDGFIARLPAASGSRVGHYERSIPVGYLESRISYKNLLQEPALRRLWDDTHIVLRGDIFTWERFAAIFWLNFQKELYLTNIKNRDEIHFNGRVYKKHFMNVLETVPPSQWTPPLCKSFKRKIWVWIKFLSY